MPKFKEVVSVYVQMEMTVTTGPNPTKKEIRREASLIAARAVHAMTFHRVKIKQWFGYLGRFYDCGPFIGEEK